MSTRFEKRVKRLRELVLANNQTKNEANNEELERLRERGKELGIPHASQKGIPKLTEEIAAKEAELEAALKKQQEGDDDKGGEDDGGE